MGRGQCLVGHHNEVRLYEILRCLFEVFVSESRRRRRPVLPSPFIINFLIRRCDCLWRSVAQCLPRSGWWNFLWYYQTGKIIQTVPLQLSSQEF